jgi:hypothetical protein
MVMSPLAFDGTGLSDDREKDTTVPTSLTSSR